jgi:hypothetical protein
MLAIRDRLLQATKAKAEAIVVWLAQDREWDFFLAAIYGFIEPDIIFGPSTLSMRRMPNPGHARDNPLD